MGKGGEEFLRMGKMHIEGGKQIIKGEKGFLRVKKNSDEAKGGNEFLRVEKNS